MKLWASSKSPSSVGIEKATRNIDTARIASPSESNWLSYGLDYDEQRYSRLAQIDSDNITDLGLDWRYDPEVPKEWGKMACCDIENRGVAIYQGKEFVGTLDARLLPLEASTGRVLWDVKTADTSEYPYTINGAPRAAKGKVFIGNGGAEIGAREFVSAYDADSGELAWRFYTVPGNPEIGQQSEAIK